MTYIRTIARATLLEALRSRLLMLMLIIMLSLFTLAEFLGELSITEAAGIKASVTASFLRVSSICLVCLFAISSGVRELNDKGVQMLLSLPMPRYAYLLGKLTGYAILSSCSACCAGLLLTLYAPAAQVACWTLSLLFEQLLMVAFSLLCLLTFANVTLSFIAAMAFYLLARSMETIQLLSAAPLLTSGGISHEVMHFLVNTVSLLLPDLHAFTRSDWLLYGVDFNDMAVVMIQTLVYLVILTAAGLFDLYRKDF